MVYPIARIILIPIIHLWIKETKGLKNIPTKGPFIIAANHESYMDHFIIVKTFAVHLNKKIHFLAKKEHFNNPLKAMWHRWAGCIPLDREAKGTKALKLAVKALKNGNIIGVHPEGTRSLTGELQKGKTGVARMALEARVPVVPVGLIGTFEIMPKGKHLPKLKRAKINIGKPIYFDKHYNKKITKRLLRSITDEIMKEIAKLSRQKYNF